MTECVMPDEDKDVNLDMLTASTGMEFKSPTYHDCSDRSAWILHH